MVLRMMVNSRCTTKNNRNSSSEEEKNTEEYLTVQTWINNISGGEAENYNSS
jgi:hypothetical protein